MPPAQKKWFKLEVNLSHLITLGAFVLGQFVYVMTWKADLENQVRMNTLNVATLQVSDKERVKTMTEFGNILSRLDERTGLILAQVQKDAAK